MAPHAPVISEKKMLYCQLCSTRYTAVRIDSCLKTTHASSAIKVARMKIMDDFCYKWNLSRAYQKINTFGGEQS